MKFVPSAAALFLAFGAGVAAAIAPKGDFFMPNFLTFWGSQLVVLACLAVCRPRAEVVAGVSVALTIYLAAFNYWNMSRAHPESMAWLGYFFSLPGAVIGAVAARYLSPGFSRPLLVGLVSSAMVLGGIAINQALVCSSLMYCGAT
ncbi:hypothetical protein [Roseateles sp.]|uniref:hypothetical protein n=1 Tax=Roseateles sp. TaxID=1971397 RepID=UPI0037C8A365